jgi:hypothetical protein
LTKRPKPSDPKNQGISPAIDSDHKSNLKKGIYELVYERISSDDHVTVGSLVANIESELGYKSDRVISKLIQLRTEGKILIIEERPINSLSGFTFSPYSLWFWGALTAVILSMISIYFTSGAALYLRYIFGGLLILFLPGYSLVEFLFARKQDMEDNLTRAALSIGLSLAIVPLVGLVLNFTPFGIRLLPVALSLGGISIILLFLSLAKKYRYYKILYNL